MSVPSYSSQGYKIKLAKKIYLLISPEYRHIRGFGGVPCLYNADRRWIELLLLSHQQVPVNTGIVWSGHTLPEDTAQSPSSACKWVIFYALELNTGIIKQLLLPDRSFSEEARPCLQHNVKYQGNTGVLCYVHLACWQLLNGHLPTATELPVKRSDCSW